MITKLFTALLAYLLVVAVAEYDFRQELHT